MNTLQMKDAHMKKNQLKEISVGKMFISPSLINHTICGLGLIYLFDSIYLGWKEGKKENKYVCLHFRHSST